MDERDSTNGGGTTPDPGTPGPDAAPPGSPGTPEPAGPPSGGTPCPDGAPPAYGTPPPHGAPVGYGAEPQYPQPYPQGYPQPYPQEPFAQQPYAQPYPGAYPAYGSYPGYPVYRSPEVSSVRTQSIVALVVSLASVLMCCLPLGIPAAITAGIALSKADTDFPRARTLVRWSWGLLVASVVLGVLGLVGIFALGWLSEPTGP